MSSYDPDDRAPCLRHLEGASSAPFDKWWARLDCGHEMLCDHAVDQPATSMRCPVCERLAQITGG